MFERVVERWNALPTPVGLAVFTLLAMAVAGCEVFSVKVFEARRVIAAPPPAG